MAIVRNPFGKIMSPSDLALWANMLTKENIFKASDFYDNSCSRLWGHMCDCSVDNNGISTGDFILLPLDAPEVKNGQKAYMRCLKCGCYSHL